MRIPSSDRDVLIRNRSDGLTELTPKLAPLRLDERWMVITTVVIASWGFYLAGSMPAPVLALLLTACLVGDVAIGAKTVILALLRPPAKVIPIPVPRFERLRRREQ
jgi:hypothetical protein